MQRCDADLGGKNLDLPTWVTAIDKYFSTFFRFSASKNAEVDARVSEDGARLYVKGFAVDTVSELIASAQTVLYDTGDLDRGNLRTRFEQCKTLALGQNSSFTQERYDSTQEDRKMDADCPARCSPGGII